MNFTDFIPPILTKMVRSFRNKTSSKRCDLFDSYESAFALCNNGYEEDKLVEVVYEKTRRFRDLLLTQKPLLFDLTSLRTFVGLNLAISDQALNVIDFGGACGAHYFLAKALFRLKGPMNLHWYVVETPKMTEIAKEMEDGQLQFFDDLEKARSQLKRIDLVFSSGALQYVPQPYEMLKQLTECGAKNIYFTRTIFSTSSRDLITIQESSLSSNGPGPMPKTIPDGIIRYPVTFPQKKMFEEIMDRNYEIKIQFSEEIQSCFAGKYPVEGFGYFGLRKTSGI